MVQPVMMTWHEIPMDTMEYLYICTRGYEFVQMYRVLQLPGMIKDCIGAMRRSSRESTILRTAQSDDKLNFKRKGAEESKEDIANDGARRTGRARDGSDLVNRNDVQLLLQRIRDSDRDHTLVLKVKENMSSAINTYVMDEILKALRKNRVCQLLYIQNLEGAITDTQLRELISILKVRKNIWALNIGETYHVTNAGWKYFCQQLPNTYITHLYVSEHTIDLALKNKMREHIRNNRSKHKKHCSLRNLSVIERCTNMWWNPINHIKHMLDAKWQAQHAPPPPPPPPEEPEAKKRKKPQVIAAEDLTPDMTAYWAEGYGEGGDKPWKFKCPCGETCSSYENYRYHPTGRMYECTQCSVWSHVDHVLGAHVSDEDLEELQDVLCNRCKSARRREKLAELKQLGIQYPFNPDGSSCIVLDNSGGGDSEESDGDDKDKDKDKDNDDEQEPTELDDNEWTISSIKRSG